MPRRRPHHSIPVKVGCFLIIFAAVASVFPEFALGRSRVGAGLDHLTDPSYRLGDPIVRLFDLWRFNRDRDKEEELLAHDPEEGDLTLIGLLFRPELRFAPLSGALEELTNRLDQVILGGLLKIPCAKQARSVACRIQVGERMGPLAHIEVKELSEQTEA